MAKVSRLLALVLVAALLFGPAIANAETPGKWTNTTGYPVQIAGDSCATLSMRIYCVGGFDANGEKHSEVYTASLSASGFGAWTAGPTYPTAIDSASCVNATNGIYCIGGEVGSTVLDDAYLAPATSSGIGAWSGVALYPADAAALSCVTYSGYIYCVGGFDSNGKEMSSAYFASTSSGLNSWSGTTHYPLPVDSESCVVVLGYMYCVGGETENGQNQNSPTTAVYRAPLSSSGIGQWQSVQALPTALAALSCAQWSGYIYCVGGVDVNLLSNSDVFYAQATSLGLSSWANANAYPLPVDTGSCVTASGYLYCVTGNSVQLNGQSMVDTAYFAAIPGGASQAATPEFPVAAAVPMVLAVGLLAVAWMGRTNRRS